MPSCSVRECSNRTKKGKKIYMASLPSDPERKKLWVTNIGKFNWKSTKYLYVCEVSNQNRFFCYKNKNVDYLKYFYRHISQMKCGKKNELTEKRN